MSKISIFNVVQIYFETAFIFTIIHIYIIAKEKLKFKLEKKTVSHTIKPIAQS